MEWLSPEFLFALLNIVIIDLVLAGDNAIVIALATRNLPKAHQKQAILWGTVGAVVIRIAATATVVWLLKLPALLLIGGVLLVWIAYKLLADHEDHAIEAKPKLWPAIRTIIIADSVMGFDNVMAVAGAAHGSFLLVVLGLIISVPIMVWGSKLFLRLLERFPWILYIGSGVLAYTAAGMLTGDPLMAGWFDANPAVKWLLTALVTGGVLAAGYLKKRLSALVSLSAEGHLTIPSELEKTADIRPEDRFEAGRDDKGRLVLVKLRN